MAVQQRQDHSVQPSPGNLGSMQSLMTTSATAWQLQKWRQDQEREWESHLRSLQQCICELLIKNQKLRDSLTSAKNRHREELGNEQDQNVTTN
jgi:hypothetical protein